ncbi:ABC transporter substrate-binding protein [Microbacterium elymi]|uniref:ABC transporter substrate-binding protein n=1 Tax=Microbacterium elymi TaxID=2909587 RepID=A0ABY5NMS1_9MICO|nr:MULTISPECIES: ABC transporter substrate-binding protein [Microbacterium]UUT36465.1 ABC transporter substrate-binding protein [Microbacterium elymi]
MTITRRAAVAALAALALALTACSGGGADDSSERVWVRAMNGDPMTTGLNAQFTTGTVPSLFSAQILDPLIFMNGDFKTSPGLATDWKLSDDGLDFTMNLRHDVTWHDGKPFTAEDVKFDFDELVPLNVAGSQLAARLDSTEIVDDDTVVLHLSKPFGPLIETISQQYMLPKHIYEGTDYLTNEANKELIGTGPMMYDSYSPGKQVVLVKNPDYWGGVSKVDKAVYSTVADPNSRAQALFAGEIDEAILDPSQVDKVDKDPNTELLTSGEYPQDDIMIFNTESEQLKDAAVRKALYSALDRHAIAETAMAGVGEPATTFLPDSLGWAVDHDVDFDKMYPFDPDAANRALDEAGFPRGADGKRFTLKVVYILTLNEVVSAVQMAQSMFADLGIDLKLVPVGGAQYSEMVYTKGDFDLAFVRANLGADPSLGVVRYFECNKDRRVGFNPSGVCDPQIDEAAAAALDTSDRAARGAALKKLQARAAELMFNVPLAWYRGAYPTINSSRWKGQDKRDLMAERMPWQTMTLG